MKILKKLFVPNTITDDMPMASTPNIDESNYHDFFPSDDLGLYFPRMLSAVNKIVISKILATPVILLKVKYCKFYFKALIDQIQKHYLPASTLISHALMVTPKGKNNDCSDDAVVKAMQDVVDNLQLLEKTQSPGEDIFVKLSASVQFLTRNVC